MFKMVFVYFLICGFCFWAILSKTFRDGLIGKVLYGFAFLGAIISISELYHPDNFQVGVPIILIAFVLLCVRTFVSVNYKEIRNSIHDGR